VSRNIVLNSGLWAFCQELELRLKFRSRIWSYGYLRGNLSSGSMYRF